MFHRNVAHMQFLQKTINQSNKYFSYTFFTKVTGKATTGNTTIGGVEIGIILTTTKEVIHNKLAFSHSKIRINLSYSKICNSDFQ